MPLKIPGAGFQLGKEKGKLIAKQDILKFQDFNLNIITASGPPLGKYEVGSLLYNGFNQKLYLSANFKTSHTPTSAWFKCNDTGLDTSGNKLELTITGATFVAGKYKKALNFDGTNDKATIPATLDFVFNTDWNLSFWIFVDSATFGAGDIIYLLERYVDATHYFKIYLIHAGGDISLKVDWENGGGLTTESLGFVVPPVFDEWMFMTLSHFNSDNELRSNWTTETTFDNLDISSNFSSAIDGASLPNIAFTTEVFTIGFSNKDTSFGDTFKIDEIKIWGDAREISPFAATIENVGNTMVDATQIDENHWVQYDGIPTN